MKYPIILLLILCLLTSVIAGCASLGETAAEPTTIVSLATPTPAAAVPTATHCYYNSATGKCEAAPVTAVPGITTRGPTPTPTEIQINKNSLAYMRYLDDLDTIQNIETDMAIINANYQAELKKVDYRNPSELTSLKAAYDKLIREDNILLETAKTRAAADLADAQAAAE
jgi:hypothetical protein